MPANTQPTRIFDLLEVISCRPAGQVMFTSVNNGEWRDYTISDYRNYADRTSYALLNFGISKGEPIVSITQNRAEFNFVDMGILQVGAVHVPLYPAIDDEKLTKILLETRSRIVFVSNRYLFLKISNLCKNLDFIEHIFTFDIVPGAMNYYDLLKIGKENQDPDTLLAVKASVTPDDLASIIYISGAATEAKGVMLTHKNHTLTVLHYAELFNFTTGTRTISILPLAHSYERTSNYALQYLGIPVYYSEGLKTIFEEIQIVKPGILFAVPLMLEKMYSSLVQKTLPVNNLLQIVYRSFIRMALNMGPKNENKWWKHLWQKLADKFVFTKWREFLGDELSVIMCGGAALPKQMYNLYKSAGIQIYEGYGITEAGPIVTVNKENLHRAYTSGCPINGVSIKIADDGELLVKSDGVMPGYYKKPQDTSAVIDKDGWLHTGDKGSIDEKGFLSITGIMKDIFKLSSGLYVNPIPIEEHFCKSSYFRNVWVSGHNRNFLSAIIVPDLNFIVSAHQGLMENPADYNALLKQAEIETIISNEVKKYNSGFRGSDQVVKYIVIAEEWSTENKFLKSDGTLNRQALTNKYDANLDKLYR